MLVLGDARPDSCEPRCRGLVVWFEQLLMRCRVTSGMYRSRRQQLKRRQAVLMRRVASGVAVLCLAVAGVAAARSATARLQIVGSVSPAPAAVKLKPAGVVRLTGPSGNATPVSGVWAADGTLVVVTGPGGATVLNVFGKPPSGWAAAADPATYAPPSASVVGAAVGDGFVATTISQPTRFEDVVLERPATGWTGALTPSATLQQPVGTSVAAAGGTTVVTHPQYGAGELDVFNEPAGGWSGTVQPSAELQAGDGADLRDVSISGDTIAAAGNNAVYIFERPAGGWAGVVDPVARIAPVAAQDGSVQLTPSTLTIVSGWANANLQRSAVYVLRRPASGWKTVAPPKSTAYALTANNSGDANPFIQTATTQGILGIAALTGFGDHECPCSSTVWAIAGLTNRRVASLKPPVPSSASIRGPSDDAIAADTNTFLLGANSRVRVYALQRSRPARVTHPALTNLTGTGKPELSLRIAAPTGGQPIKAVQVTIPPEFAINPSATVRRQGVLVSNARVATRAWQDATLKIKLARGSSKITVAVGDGLLIERPALRAALTRLSHPGGRLTLSTIVRTANTRGTASASVATFTIKR